MEQPKNPTASPPPPPPHYVAAGDTKTSKTRRQPPSPEEMIAFYESKGLDRQAASLKAIEDLQSLLLRGADASRRDRLPPSGDLQRKLDNAIARLAILDMKLDSKPGYPESLAIGVASGALLGGLSAALPSALRALGDTWRFVASAANHRTPPP
ncbi:hypothetical protein KSP40_PGU011961 [Platanthera guangdongensis]|uniref:Uncharacterized protein n=1 Tax=Platanthera guangdongensis TaxID=2320717 RepID=A0ABR2MUM2_9ASPA